MHWDGLEKRILNDIVMGEGGIADMAGGRRLDNEWYYIIRYKEKAGFTRTKQRKT